MSQEVAERTPQVDPNDLDNLLGLDLDKEKEDLTIPPKRKKINNLNETHFLQTRGLPYLLKSCSRVLKPKMKHKDEYKNLTNLLSFYQLWGHKIYPKANFKDFLDMTMKVGAKSKHMKILRESWIKEDMKKNDDELATYLPGVGNSTEQHTGEQHTGEQNDDSDDDDINTSFTHRRNRNNLFVAEEDEDDDDLYSVPQRNIFEKQVTIPTNQQPQTTTTSNETNTTEISTTNTPMANEITQIEDNSDNEFDDDLDDEFDSLVRNPTDLIRSQLPAPTTAPKETFTQDDIPEDLDMLLELEREAKIKAKQEVDEEDDYELALLREAGF